ncbi:MAG: ribosome-associated translation inhibitor RaiA [Bacteroidia bacterium]
MKVEFEKIPEGVNSQLTELIERKLQKLERYYENIVHTVVYLRENGGVSKELEVKLIVKDQTLFVKEDATTFEEALEKAIETMSRQLKKYKDKLKEK